MHAEKIIFLTDVDGIYEDQGADLTPVSECDLAYLGALQAAGRIGGGMVPKVAAVRKALEAGVGSAHIIDGRVEHAVLLEIMTDAGLRHQGDRVTAAALARRGIRLHIPGEGGVFYAAGCRGNGCTDRIAAAALVAGDLQRMNQRAPMSKTERQRLIQTVVQQREIATQRELVGALSALGCEVTQATVSRDIRELDLQKVRTHLGRAKYVLSSRERPKDPEQAARHVLRDFARSTAVSHSCWWCAARSARRPPSRARSTTSTTPTSSAPSPATTPSWSSWTRPTRRTR